MHASTTSLLTMEGQAMVFRQTQKKN